MSRAEAAINALNAENCTAWFHGQPGCICTPIKGVVMDDQIFQSLADGYPMHKVWMVSLSDMWDDIEKTLGHGVRFLTETERERMMP